MSSENEHDKKSKLKAFNKFQRTHSRAIMIPTVLFAYPIGGLLIGQWIDNRYNTSPWFLILFLVAGFVKAAREIAFITKVLERESESTDEGAEGNGDQ